MNVFFVFDDGSMVTPPLTGTILPGITRDFNHPHRPRPGSDGARRAYGIERARRRRERPA